MFKKINRDSVSRFVKGNATTAIVVGAVVGQAAFAQTTVGAMDVAEPLAYIAAGVVAKNLIGPAWTGIKYLGKVWQKI